MSLTEYNIGTVNNSFLKRWKGYKQVHDNLVKKEKVKWKTISSKKMIKVAGFAGMQRAKINGVWKPGTVIALKDIFGKDLVNAEYLMVQGTKIPIVRGDKRVELTRKFPGINRGDMIEVRAYHKEKIQGEDKIPIESIDYDLYVVGQYKSKQRNIKIKGVKRVLVGQREPLNAGSDFWKDIFNEIKNEVMDEDDKPNGVWFDRLMQLEEFKGKPVGGFYPKGDASSDLTEEGWVWGIDENAGDFDDLEDLGNREIT